MREVATGANVSLQTVSNYVNGRHHLMSEETRDRVGRELEALGYWPNAAARTLRARRSMTLGFLLVDESSAFLADRMTDLIIAGIGDVARDAGYSVLIQGASPEPDRVDGLFAPLLENRVDGAILFLSGKPALRRRVVRRITELGFACVVFERFPASWSVSSVTADNREGTRRLVEHLISKGHRRIGFMSTRTPWPMADERILGYRDGLKGAGIAFDAELEVAHGVWNPTDGSAMAQHLLSLADRPTAIMGANDLLALGAIQAAKNLGLRVPQDVAVTGFNDFEFAEFVEPPLTSVAVPGYELGRIAALTLLEQLVPGQVPQGPTQVNLAVELKLRESS
jgi:DNA-binding LacI/PurR family transcriptional regulator